MEPSAIEMQLRRRWAPLAAIAGWAAVDAEDVLADLLRRYASADRYYHNQEHLLECLVELEPAFSADVAVALWFHDAIYEATRSDNEAASADLAASQLTRLGAPADQIGRVRDLILDTAHQRQPASPDGQLIVDIDLSILGTSVNRFDRYDADIRREYAHVLEPAYRTGRAAVLRSFLARPHIYRTPRFQNRYEAAARTNLASAIARLTSAAG